VRLIFLQCQLFHVSRVAIHCYSARPSETEDSHWHSHHYWHRTPLDAWWAAPTDLHMLAAVVGSNRGLDMLNATRAPKPIGSTSADEARTRV
jgi:hypothetical protein